MAMGAAIHASAIILGEVGVLIRGRSGSGKSSLAAALVGEAGRRNIFARLVGDDRILLSSAGERILVRPHPAIAGLIEKRWEGIVPVSHEPVAVLRFAIDLVDSASEAPARLPEAAKMRFTRGNITIPQLVLPDSLDSARLIERVFGFLNHHAQQDLRKK